MTTTPTKPQNTTEAPEIMMHNISTFLIQSFVTCIFGIDKVGYVMICFGVGDSLFSYLLGKLTKYVGRIPIFISGAVIHLVVYVVLLTWKPDSDLISVAFLMAALWGYTDAVWQTQINGKRICC